MRCGLLGAKLTHSYSPFIHSLLADYPYDLFEKKAEDLDDFLKYGDFSGLNVTTPYKKSVVSYCHELTPIAAKLGSVNTVIRRPDGTLLGHNTDHYGFSSMLQRSGLSIEGKKVLVLGSGGASVTVVDVLKNAGAKVVVVSRTGENNYDNLSLHKDTAVIVNTTPVGMYPNNGFSPLSLEYFPVLEGVLDLIYNPAKTALLLDAEKRNLVTENGLWMLVAQAVESAKWFTGKQYSDDAILNIFHLLYKKARNIVLIGMPGSGKSTVGKFLAAKLSREFIDSDAWIEQTTGLAIPQIIQQSGEAAFREIEKNALKELGKKSGIILATGGGCVTKPENYTALHQNSTIYYLNRDINKLPTNGRPLSQNISLADLYQIRKPLYETFADHTIDNNKTVEDTVQMIINLEG